MKVIHNNLKRENVKAIFYWCTKFEKQILKKTVVGASLTNKQTERKEKTGG